MHEREGEKGKRGKGVKANEGKVKNNVTEEEAVEPHKGEGDRRGVKKTYKK